MADLELIKPRELPEASAVYADDAIMTDDGVTVSKATPAQIVNAGAPVPTEAAAIAGTDNTARMTPLRVKQVLDNVTAPSVQRAQAWAESNTAPDPGSPASKSAKKWAEEADRLGAEQADRAEAAAVAASASAARVDLGALDSAVATTAADRVQTGLDRAAAASQASLAAVEKAAAEAARIAAQAAADASIQAGQWDQEVADEAARLALTGLATNWQVYQLDTERVWRWDGAVWVDRGESPLALKASKYVERAVTGVASVSPNLFDKDALDFSPDSLVGYNTGAVVSNAAYDTSGFIQVNAGLNYRLQDLGGLAWYNAELSFISGVQQTDVNVSVTAPAGAAFMRASIRKNVTDKDRFYVVAGTEPLADYLPYGGYFSVPSENFPKGLIHPEHTSFLVVGDNLFDKSARTLNAYQGTSIEQSGPDYDLSDFIPVEEGKTYYYSTARFRACLNVFKRQVGGQSSNDNSTSYTVPVGSGVKWMRLSMVKAAVDTFMVSEGSLKPFVPFGYKLTDEILLPEVTGITPEQVSFLERGYNLFDKSARTLDQMQSTGANPVYSDQYDLSDFIPISEGVAYYYGNAVGGARFRTVFNASKAVISAESTVSDNSAYTPPLGSGAAFMRLTLYKNRVDTFMVSEGELRPFEPYGFKFTDEIISGNGSSEDSGWTGKKFSSFGDSITAQQSWQPSVAATLGLFHTAYGVGGRMVCGASGMNTLSAIETLPLDSDLITVLGGTNDWAQTKPLGSADSSNIEEFRGAYNVMCQRLTERFPTARIVLLTTPYGELPSRVTDGFWVSADTNPLGLTTRDYAEVVREMGKRWGFPVVDLSACGWNAGNIAEFMLADGGLLHPNALGGKRMAGCVVGTLRAISTV